MNGYIEELNKLDNNKRQIELQKLRVNKKEEYAKKRY